MSFYKPLEQSLHGDDEVTVVQDEGRETNEKLFESPQLRFNDLQRRRGDADVNAWKAYVPFVVILLSASLNVLQYLYSLIPGSDSQHLGYSELGAVTSL